MQLKETQHKHTGCWDAFSSDRPGQRPRPPRGATRTHLQHCFFMLRPPNLGLSKQLVQTPQSSGTWQPGHCPHRLDRRPFFTGGSWGALFLVTGLIGLMGGARGSASSEPAIDDLSVKGMHHQLWGSIWCLPASRGEILTTYWCQYTHSNLLLTGTPEMKFTIIVICRTQSLF